MSKPKPKMRKVCEICGREFFAANEHRCICDNPDCKRERQNQRQRESYARNGRTRKPTERRRFAKVYASAEHFERIMAEVHAPIGDDEPLSKYVGGAR